MPYFFGLLALLAGAYLWAGRARNAGLIAQDLAGMAGDVVNAARAFGFRRRANIHPVESLDDPVVAVAGLGVAFMEMGSLPSAEQHKALVESLQIQLSQGQKQAEEAVILGRWLMAECGSPQAGFDRLAKRLWKLDGVARFEPLMAVLKGVAANGPALSSRQSDALQDLSAIFRLR
jgi:hypothetical protein